MVPRLMASLITLYYFLTVVRVKDGDGRTTPLHVFGAGLGVTPLHVVALTCKCFHVVQTVYYSSSSFARASCWRRLHRYHACTSSSHAGHGRRVERESPSPATTSAAASSFRFSFSTWRQLPCESTGTHEFLLTSRLSQTKSVSLLIVSSPAMRCPVTASTSDVISHLLSHGNYIQRILPSRLRLTSAHVSRLLYLMSSAVAATVSDVISHRGCYIRRHLFPRLQLMCS